MLPKEYIVKTNDIKECQIVLDNYYHVQDKISMTYPYIICFKTDNGCLNYKSLNLGSEIRTEFLNLPLFTFDEWKELITYISDDNYVAPFDLFGGRVKMGDVFVKYEFGEGYVPKGKEINEYILPSEIVEKWAKKTSHIEKGSQIIITDFGRANISSGAFTLNTVYTLKEDFTYQNGLRIMSDNFNTKNNGWTNAVELGIKIRFATRVEIDTQNEFNIGQQPFKVRVSLDGIFQGKENITEFVRELIRHFFESNTLYFGGYSTIIDDVVFRGTVYNGSETRLSEWKEIYAKYLSITLQN